MSRYQDHYDARTADMSALGSGTREWADKWAAIIRNGMAEAEARAKAKQRTTALPDEIAIRDRHGLELATVTPCDGGAMVKIEDPAGTWRETMFIQEDLIRRVGEALMTVSEART